MASVLTSAEAGVQTITLNRPEKLNAFIPEMHKELRRALEQALELNLLEFLPRGLLDRLERKAVHVLFSRNSATALR